jgi:hypothetical protein
MRGIVLAPQIWVTQEGDFHFSYEINRSEFRKYVLYWDKIAWADLKRLNDDIVTKRDGQRQLFFDISDN